ncbi:hypothetical protein VTK73DRAFT_8019 [Phialemonium thermophilum]|uniref:Annexin n=1 Tax=Phialemonium thermophilum TaxID=223376 RepID=A0ABR3XQ82_9PEZI
MSQPPYYGGSAPPPGQYPPYYAPPANPPAPGYPPAQPGAPPYYQQPPAGAAPPPGQPPYQQQQAYPSYGAPAPPGQPLPAQYQGYQYPGSQPPPAAQYVQPQPPAQYPNQPYPPQQPGVYGQQPYPPQGQPIAGAPPGVPYPQQQPYPPPQVGAPPQQQPWGQPTPPVQYHVQPTPASPGYDPAQKAWVARVDTSADVESLRKAMKGMGCDEGAVVKVLTSPKYAYPWAMAQLVQDYNSRFIRDLAKDIESETRGNLELTLLALLRGPLENDARTLARALDRAGTDEEALMDVLLCRSNADIRAITAEYKRVTNRELLKDLRDDVDDNLFRLYSMVLAATRAEDAVPPHPAEIDQKVTELQRATEGTIGANAVAVAQIFTSSNDAQLRAVDEAYKRKYHRSLEDVIEKEFRGDMEDALLRMLYHARDRARLDAERLRQPLFHTVRKDKLLIYRVTSLYWDRSRFEAAKEAYKRRFHQNFAKDIKEFLSGDYEDAMLALIGDKK